MIEHDRSFITSGSGLVILLLLVHCTLLLHYACVWGGDGGIVWSLFCDFLLIVFSSLVITLQREREREREREMVAIL